MNASVTFEEAAERLGIQLRSVYSLVKGGRLQTVHSTDGTRRIPLDNLVAYQELQHQKLSLPDVAYIAKLAAAKVATLERQVERLTSMLGLDVPTLGVTQGEVLGLYSEIEILLAEKILPISVQFIAQWSRIFYAMGEEQFQLIAEHTADPEPWSKPLKLARRIFEEKPISQELELEQAYRHLLVARRFMRQAAYFYIRGLHGTREAHRMFKEIEGGVDQQILAVAFPTN